LRAGDLANTAEFFSVGSNDLTQLCLGFSRDDAEAKFMSTYLKTGILAVDPFESLDPIGVGELIKLTVERGRATRPGMSIGICGEHGGDPKSIAFCDSVGLDYVSCSPLRVPIARLAAAQAAIQAKSKGKNDHCQD
jgi:pyruvate,orthophosphate dikinase